MAAGQEPGLASDHGGMTIETNEFLLHSRLEPDVLETWIQIGWLLPGRSDGDRYFSEVDLARVQLIRDLHDLGVNDDGVPVVLDLIDQLHGLRHTLQALLATISAQPQSARRRIISDIRAARFRALAPTPGRRQSLDDEQFG
jgi:chaperone modulatory protein CbpM